MAEPLSIAASAIAIATAGYELAKSLKSYVSSVRNYEKQLQPVIEHMNLTSDIVTSIASLLANEEIRSLYTAELLKSTNNALNGCQQAFKDLEAFVQNSIQSNNGGKLQGITAKLTFVFKQKDLDALRAHLETFKSHLNLVIGVLNFASSARSAMDSNAIADMKQNIERLVVAEQQARHKETELLRDKSLPEPSCSTLPAQTASSFPASSFPAFRAARSISRDARTSEHSSSHNSQSWLDSVHEDSILQHLNKCASAAATLSIDVGKALNYWHRSQEFQPQSLHDTFRTVLEAMNAILCYGNDNSMTLEAMCRNVQGFPNITGDTKASPTSFTPDQQQQASLFLGGAHGDFRNGQQKLQQPPIVPSQSDNIWQSQGFQNSVSDINAIPAYDLKQGFEQSNASLGTPILKDLPSSANTPIAAIQSHSPTSPHLLPNMARHHSQSPSPQSSPSYHQVIYAREWSSPGSVMVRQPRKRSFSEMAEHSEHSRNGSRADSNVYLRYMPSGEEDSPPRQRSNTAIHRPDPPTNKQNKYVCTYSLECEGQTFDRKCEWNKHMDKHERPYRCTHPDCARMQGFTYSGGLLRHEREAHGKHGGPKSQLMCDYPDCKRKNKGFTRKENLNEHIRRVHTKYPDPLEMASVNENPREYSLETMNETTRSDNVISAVDKLLQAWTTLDCPSMTA